jgi:hypothetical protein
MTDDTPSVGIRKQIDCSDEDWEIINTLVPWLATAEKVRAAMPGTPIIPLPSTVTMLNLLMTVTALTVSGVVSE